MNTVAPMANVRGTIADYLSRPGNLTFTSSDVFRLELKGDFVVGSTVRVAGVASADLLYTVTAQDLSVDGDGMGGAATSAQVAARIAGKLADLALAAPGLRASVDLLEGAVLRFESLEGDPAGALSVRATATGGVVLLSRPPGTLVMRVDDGVNVREQTITLDVTRPSSINAVFNGSGLEVIDPDGTSLRLSKFALDDLRLGSKADSFTVTRLGAAPIRLVATEGADRTQVNLGNTVSPDGSLRALTLVDAIEGSRSLLADDTLTLALKPQPAKSSGAGTLVQLGQSPAARAGLPDVVRMLSGVEDVRWDETLGQLVIQGDIVRLTGFTDANGQTLPMDLGETKVRIVAQRLSIESDLVAGALVLDVSERLTLDGDLLRHGDNVKFELARVIPADRAPQIVAAQTVAGPLDAAQLAALAAQNAGQGLQLKPADPNAPISIGGAGGSGMSLDPSQLSAIPVLVVGATGGSNPVALGGAGSSLAMNTPLEIGRAHV
jgi:hypothetical protein